MKKIYLIFSLCLCMLLSGCDEKITLDNVDQYKAPSLYSKVSLGKLVECDEDSIIGDIKVFTNKFLSIVWNRSYKNNTTVEYEKIMFSKEFPEEKAKMLSDDIMATKKFYKEYELATELVNIDYESIVNCKGDAYVICVARLRLTECNDEKVSKIMGFPEGIGSDVLCKLKMKYKYKDKNYLVYDCEQVEEEGYLFPIKKYPDIIFNTLTKEERLERFVFVVSKTQNDRVYYELSGDEDYKYLSKAYRKYLNKDRDDVKYTRDLYIKYKMSTKLMGCTVEKIEKTDMGYIVRATLDIKLLECVNERMAKSSGFPEGIGSIEKKKYDYYIIEEDGEFKVDNMKFLSSAKEE